jgi:peptide/nickel transport system permease protein
MRYVLRQSAQAILTVLGIVTVVFFLIRLIPGDPATYMLGDYATTDAIAALRSRLGLDLPLLHQFLLFIGHLLQGDLGQSVVTGQPAIGEVLDSFAPSAALSFSAMLVAIAIGVPLGITAARYNRTFWDLAVTVVALVGISAPVFWLGLAAILFLSSDLGWFPALGTTSSSNLLVQLHHLALPAFVLGLSVSAYIARLTRSAMLEILGADYIRVARAMGVPERRIIGRLALRNALVPILSIVGVSFATSLGSAILVEIVFSRPGIGSLMLKAVLARDYQLVQAGIMFMAASVVLVNFVLELAYRLVDPRL